MNLRDFLNYRNNCPICDKQLKFIFHSKRRQKINYIDDRIVITFPMDSIKKNERSYLISFAIDPVKNSFFIDFASEQGEKFDNIPLSIVKKFLSFNANLGAYAFYKQCDCGRYTYGSNYFNLDLKNRKFPDTSIQKEVFTLILAQFNDDGYKTCKLLNNYETNKSILDFWKSKPSVLDGNTIYYDELKSDILVTNLIKFVSIEETVARINKLLVFS